MTEYVPVSEAKARLSELVHTSEADDVVLMRHGRPAAVILSAQRHAELMEHLDDLEDRLAITERGDDGLAVSWDKLRAELGV